MNTTIYSFNGGEFSPRLDRRADISKYSKGCRIMENFIATSYGEAERRPGTEYIAAAKYADKQCRLIPFRFSVNSTFVLEFGHEYIRFFQDGEQILDATDAIYEIESPYQENELAELQFVQSADVMFIVHGNHAPQQLSHYAEANWTLEDFEFDFPPFMDENTDDNLTITPSGTAEGNSITLTASDDLFDAAHVGAFFEITHIRSDNELSGTFSSNSTSSTIKVSQTTWNLITHDTWTGTLRVERSFDNGTTWGHYRSYSSEDDFNVDVNGEEELEDVLYRLRMTGWSSGACDFDFTVDDYYVNGIARITGVASATSATATVIKEIARTSATSEWSEGSFSDKNGYPGALAFFQERLIFASTAAEPQTVFGSKNNSWRNFKKGDLDDDAIIYTIASDSVNAIRWLVTRQEALLIGTMGGEWKMSAADTGDVLSPTTVRVLPQTNYGGSIYAQAINDAVLFVQRQRRKVREFVYKYETNSFVCPDMTVMSEHITKGGICGTAYQQQPDSILWAVTGEGNLIGMTYERDQEVIAWHRHNTEGSFESVASVSTDNEDELYVAVKRTIDGSTVRYIERFAARSLETVSDSWFVDSGKEFSLETASPTLTGLDHLEGCTVSVFADDSPFTDTVVENGEITLPSAVSSAVVGLPFTSKLQPMKLDLTNGPESTITRKRFISKITACFYNTVGGLIGTNEDNLVPVAMRFTSDDIDEALPLWTGDYEMTMPGGYDSGGDILIVQSEPLPMTVLALIANMEVTG